VFSTSCPLQRCLFKNTAWLDNGDKVWGVAVLGQRVLDQYDLSSDGKGVNSSLLKQLHFTGAIDVLAASSDLLKKMLVRGWFAAFLLSGSDPFEQGYTRTDQLPVNCKKGLCRKKAPMKEGLAALLTALGRGKGAGGQDPSPAAAAGAGGGAVAPPVLSGGCRAVPRRCGDRGCGRHGPSAVPAVGFGNVPLGR